MKKYIGATREQIDESDDRRELLDIISGSLDDAGWTILDDTNAELYVIKDGYRMYSIKCELVPG